MEPIELEWLRIAYKLALGSPDPSTQNGAIVLDGNYNIVGRGCNEFTGGMDITPDLLERPKKYTYIEHAERNAIYNAMSKIPDFSKLEDGGVFQWDFTFGKPVTMVAAWAACADCARGIVQSGIQTLIRHDRSGVDRWNESIEAGDEILRAAGVKVVDIPGKIGYCDPVLANGELWQP